MNRKPSLRPLRFTYLLQHFSPCFDYPALWLNCHKHNLVLLHTMFWKPELSHRKPTWHLPLSMLRDRIRSSSENFYFFSLNWLFVISVQMTQLCMGFIFSVCSLGSSKGRWLTIRKHRMNWQCWCLIEPLQCSQTEASKYNRLERNLPLFSPGFIICAIPVQYTVE